MAAIERIEKGLLLTINLQLSKMKPPQLHHTKTHRANGTLYIQVFFLLVLHQLLCPKMLRLTIPAIPVEPFIERHGIRTRA